MIPTYDSLATSSEQKPIWNVRRKKNDFDILAETKTTASRGH